ncbi:MAG TPA: NAD+ synthase [Pelomicrobium sp.]|nr:NAD+ synthase [Pelomicrobium sp.]
MKIAIAQMNGVVGDLAGNAAAIVEQASRARDAGAALMVTPEMSLAGYPPEDLLLRDGFYRACDDALLRLKERVRGIAVVVGHPRQVDGRRFNAASVIRDGEIVATYHKRKLPNYEVFDEERYFDAGDEPCVVEIEGVRFGLNICADVWEEGAPDRARAAGAQVLLTLNASPYHLRKQATRYEVVRSRIAATGIPVVYVNRVGGQDELVFDGASFVLDGTGELMAQLPEFEERLALVPFDGPVPVPAEIAPPQPLEASVYRALCLGVRDYVLHNRFPQALLGVSGGIDSALTLCIAADALGPERVRAIMMPSQYTADMSVTDAEALSRNLGVRYDEFNIKSVYDAYLRLLAREFDDLPFDTTEENLQSRIRGMLLMALSNKYGSIVLTTGNKSEMAVGYATLYGDMAGGFAVLKDISKTLVYRLARHRNVIAPVIPERILTRAPSAELRPDQRDEDSLPPYDTLDAIVVAYMEQDRSVPEIVAAGFDAGTVRRVVGLIQRNEYKRRQAPVGIRITQRGFGKDWRYPITSRYQDDF